MAETISDFFEALGAPLKNVRTSWGAQRKDGVIFLRCWKDHSHVDDRGEWMQVGFREGDSHGWRERQEHIRAIEHGARCFIVICEAEDVNAEPRVIERFNRQTLAVGGELKRQDGRTWIRIAGYKSKWELR